MFGLKRKSISFPEKLNCIAYFGVFGFILFTTFSFLDLPCSKDGIDDSCTKDLVVGFAASVIFPLVILAAFLSTLVRFYPRLDSWYCDRSDKPANTDTGTGTGGPGSRWD